MRERAVALRTLAVFAIGLAVLAAILYYASTVDGRAPTVLHVSLTQHLTGGVDTALTTSSIEIAFSEPVQHPTAVAAFAISPAVDGSFSWSSASMTFTPAARLPLRTEFEVTIGPGVRDAVGNAMATAAAPFHFTTVGNPSVVASDPADGAADVALDAAIVVDFSTLMDTASVERALSLAPAGDVRLRWAGERLTITPLAPLDPNRRYLLTIGTGALDQAGTPLESAFRLSIRTVLSSLSAGTLVPGDGVAGVAIDTAVAIVFDRDLDPDSVHDDLLTIEPAVAGSLAAIVSPGAAGLRDGELRMLRFQPSGSLEPNTTYEVTLKPGLLGADGAGLPVGLSWSFTTGAPAGSLSNQIVFVSDRGGIANLWAMNPDGTNQRQLSAELSPVIDYAVAPDGRAFVVGDGAVLVWQRADGSARRLLTDADAVEFDPAYSPDGATLVFGRADPALATGLGLWTSDAEGSDPRPIELPTPAVASPSPSGATRVPLLRAPRISPDGTALAFVDDVGRVAILDLETAHLSAASLIAFSEPIWLPDSSGVLVSGLPGGSGSAARIYRHGSPVPILDPGSFELDETQLAGLRIVRLDRGATAVTRTPFGGGAVRPTVDASGRIAFVTLELPGTGAGSPQLADALGDASDPVLGDPSARADFISLTPEQDAALISRGAVPGDIGTAARGIWLVNLGTGTAKQLSPDGWLPRWLP